MWCMLQKKRRLNTKKCGWAHGVGASGQVFGFRVHVKGSGFSVGNVLLLGPYSRTMPRVLWWSYGWAQSRHDDSPPPPPRKLVLAVQERVQGVGCTRPPT